MTLGKEGITRMIVFLSFYPDELTERDGMMQRVAAIDSMFSGHRRLYLRVSLKGYRRHTVTVRGPVSIERVNLFIHHRYIDYRLREASCVYVHSVLNALSPLPYLWKFNHKTVLDLHGVVPEELVFMGRRKLATFYSFAEWVMVKNCRLVVVVTQKMRQHFLTKYGGYLDASRILTLPNMVPRQVLPPEPRCERAESPILRLIYAGGVHKWQNIDLMMGTLRQLATVREDWQARIYVPENAIFEVQEKVDQACGGSRIAVGSLPHSEVMKEYATADAGFILRDATLLNKVAMPTKLVEYMNYGVVPIVLSPDIGDFPMLGYRYLTLNDLFDKDKLSPDRLEEMRAINSRIMAALCDSASEARHALVSLLDGSDLRLSPGSGVDVAGVRVL
jgi:glycosyltransferase involved in cell wall biosynthesis